MAKQGYCHCDARLPLSGRCAYGCSPLADPAHLAEQARKRRANDERRRVHDRPFITPEDHKRMNEALARFDPFYRHALRRRKRMAAIHCAAGGRR